MAVAGAGRGLHRRACAAQRIGYGGTVGDASDDVYVSACTPFVAAGGAMATLMYDSSLTDCSGDFACEPGETCLGVPIGTGAAGDTALELLCVSQIGPLGANATAPLGAPCPLDSANPYTCASLYCLPGDAPNTGYCSQLCTTDDDCVAGAMTCQPLTLLDRKDDSQDVSIGLCRMK